MLSAKQASAAAVDALRDGVSFAVVAGTDRARMVYPVEGRLAVADARTKAEAKTAIGRLKAGGGTAIGQWLTQANRLFVGHQQAIKHAILLTDGRNEHETPAELDNALALCEGRFVCDC